VLLVGLTGGVASGKSIVAQMLVELGAHLIDTDQLARKVVEPDRPAWRDIVARWGEGILNEDRSINRGKLAQIIFSNPKARKELEGMTHPRIDEEVKRLVEELEYADNGRGIIIIDIPLLYEVNWQDKVDLVMVVYADEDTQIERLLKRRGMTREEAQARLNSQIPLSEKVKYADFVIDNSGPMQRTKDQVKEIFGKLVEYEKSHHNSDG